MIEEKIFLKTDLKKTPEEYEYLGLKNSLKLMPEEIVKKITESGLRGRGGAGFPTGRKWQYALAQENDVKFLICNADEGEPGTFKDRFLLENMPFKVLEGIIIAAYAVKANYGYIYIRGEYSKAIEIFEKTIKDAYHSGLLGKDILGSGFDFELKLVKGAGAYVCGDETSLINSIEGKRGFSRIKPPYPVQEGLFGKPTVVNNVETLATVAEIMKYEDNVYARLGTEKSRGTKLISINGDVKVPDVYEIEFGSCTIREIVELAGGPIEELNFVVPGGIATSILKDNEINVRYTYEDLEAAGSSIGSGGMIVVSKNHDLIEILLNVSEFFVKETCGTCFPCREGNRNIKEILLKLKRNGYNDEYKKIIGELKESIMLAARCGFGQSSVNFIYSVLDKFFKEEVI
ncbi:NADH:ubiquinone oxidoreductase, NADH-binding (51 kD) subunit [Marinitoga piezophila KA3]|uniref:NADH:ubiquinone oxidoreductase, NADH-binding (51 kD) subunit n=1 Tax=Marinitoga piezophila (strain DSM 14283 / JCM 11233 / KA3) TaxID=443254 RepID=H2J7T5_MARPK|nr:MULTISPECIES: NADH-ubiquinone oxidoreductase-F iron-sulfur binding region domain-containing protein [Marinitoga]AEX85426.1 NADH:ubiquinone oxidoreductase, NADH-binding (51 kD) subunit [Marinitoga piezophila KA3]APT75900.1 NADH dehydrogenase [Marinitoga sp. 1137]